jgi:hypothetical protein
VNERELQPALRRHLTRLVFRTARLPRPYEGDALACDASPFSSPLRPLKPTEVYGAGLSSHATVPLCNLLSHFVIALDDSTSVGGPQSYKKP